VSDLLLQVYGVNSLRYALGLSSQRPDGRVGGADRSEKRQWIADDVDCSVLQFGGYRSGAVLQEEIVEAAAAIPEGIEAQTRLVIDNLCRVLAGLGLGLPDVVRTGACLTHFEQDYEIFNRLYRSYFEPGRLPARTCIGVTALARGARVEIDFIARRSLDVRDG
jgi:enamine deaminase RidA (YjgF/YER057c/UK114 family)